MTQFLSRIPNPKDLDCMHLCSLKHLDTMSPPLLRRTNEARLSLHVPPIAIKRILLSCSYIDDINLSSDQRKWAKDHTDYYAGHNVFSRTKVAKRQRGKSLHKCGVSQFQTEWTEDLTWVPTWKVAPPNHRSPNRLSTSTAATCTLHARIVVPLLMLFLLSRGALFSCHWMLEGLVIIALDHSCLHCLL